MSLSQRKRFDILERDEFRCRYCGRMAPLVELEVDHVHPRCENGPDVPDNLVSACVDCNRGKRDRILRPSGEWRPTARCRSLVWCWLMESFPHREYAHLTPDALTLFAATRPIDFLELIREVKAWCAQRPGRRPLAWERLVALVVAKASEGGIQVDYDFSRAYEA